MRGFVSQSREIGIKWNIFRGGEWRRAILLSCFSRKIDLLVKMRSNVSVYEIRKEDLSERWSGFCNKYPLGIIGCLKSS